MTDREGDFNTETAGEGGPKGKPAPKIEHLGTFKIEKELSSGGGGTVYLAYDESMKRRVALKVLHPSLGISDTAQTRFAREAWIAGQLEHTNIVKVYSRGEENQLNFIALEYAEGGSLSDYIIQLRNEAQKSKEFKTTVNKEHIRSLVSKFIELANALEYIHSKGFIHRDIKPHNILLAGDTKQFKLTDFGIAHAQDMTRMTKKGDFIGTIHYMSPEQITAHRTTVDKRTDIYSLGVTLYESLTLSLPFEADSEEKLIGEIISGHYIPARKRIRSIPKDLETILMKATHHDASRRYQSAKEFADDLRRFIEDKPIVARPDSVFYKAGKTLSLKRRVNQVVLVILILIVASGVVLSKMQQNRYDREKILTTLKRAVESKTSPFEFEPDWPRLQKKLYNHVKKGQLDSTMIWFLKTASIPEYTYQKYTPIEKAEFNVTTSGLKIFEDKFRPLNNLFIHKSIIESLEGDLEFSNGYLFYNYDVMQSFAQLGFSLQFLKEVKTDQTGKFKIPIKMSTEHYINSSFYENIKGKKVPTYLDSIKIVNDTLMKLPFKSIGTLHEDFIALNNFTFSPTSPIFVDELNDTLEIFLFKDWPANFPKTVNSKNIGIDTAQNFGMDRIEFVKLAESNYRVRVYYFENNNADLPPFAFYLEVKDKKSGSVFLTGTLTVSETGFYWLKFVEFGLNAKFWNWGMKYDDSIITERFWLGKSVPAEDSMMFNKFAEMGEVEAELKLMPSIELARETGEMSEFWGDTLIFNITFQAIDSSNSN